MNETLMRTIRIAIPTMLILLGACNGPQEKMPEPAVAATSDSVQNNSKPTSDLTPVNKAAQSGPQVIHTKDGGRMEGVMEQGQRVGTWSSFFPDGTLRSTVSYEDGLEEGPTLVNHPNGSPYYKGSYHRGRNFGKWVFYDETGAELKRVEFDSTGVARGH